MPLDTPDYGQASAPGQLTIMNLVGAGAPIGPQTIKVGAAVHALMFLSSSNAQTWTLSGSQSGTIYLTYSSAVIGSVPIVFPWFSSLDASVLVTNSGGAVANGTSSQLVAIYDTMAVSIFGSGTNPVSVGTIAAANSVNGNPLATLPGASAVGQPLAGAITAAAGGTIITIPTSRQWLGTVWVSGVASAGGASVVDVQTASTFDPGGGVSLARIALPAGSAPMTLSVPGIYVTAGTGGAGTITLIASGAAAVACGAAGILL